jgi:hypothetical protein
MTPGTLRKPDPRPLPARQSRTGPRGTQSLLISGDAPRLPGGVPRQRGMRPLSLFRPSAWPCAAGPGAADSGLAGAGRGHAPSGEFGSGSPPGRPRQDGPPSGWPGSGGGQRVVAELGQDMAGLAEDLAGLGQGGALAALAVLDGGVVVVVGAEARAWVLPASYTAQRSRHEPATTPAAERDRAGRADTAIPSMHRYPAQVTDSEPNGRREPPTCARWRSGAVTSPAAQIRISCRTGSRAAGARRAWPRASRSRIRALSRSRCS